MGRPHAPARRGRPVLSLDASAPGRAARFISIVLVLFLLHPAAAHSVSGGLSFVEPLTTSLTFGGQQGAWGIAKGDFDHDGKLDLAVTDNRADHPTSASEGGAIHVLLGLGDGRFKPPVAYLLPRRMNGQGAYPYGILAKDFNRDGDLDLVTVSAELRQVLFLRGHGDGTFADPVASATVGDNVAVQAGDVDGDQILDLVVLSPGSNSIEILRGSGDGSFEQSARRDANGPTDAALADLDGDQDLDLVLSVWGESEMKLFVNQGGGVFAATPTGINVGVKQIGGFYLAKFDADSFPDLVVAGPFGHCPTPAWVFIKGLGNGTFKPPDGSDCIGPVDTPQRFGLKYLGENVAPDLDGDGRADVVFWGFGNTFERGLSRGDGTFVRGEWAISPGPGFDHPGHGAVDCNVPQSFVTGDFDGNGSVDVVVAAQEGNLCRPGGVSLIPGGPSGSYRAPRFFGLNAQANPRSTGLADFDEDGNLDLIFARSTGALRALGGGDGTLSNPPVGIPGAECSREIRVADLDGDRHQDFVCLSGQSNAGSVGFGDGHGNFEVHLIPMPQAFGGQPSALAVADFNADTRQDLAIVYVGGCSGICSSSDVHIYLLNAAPTRDYVEFPEVAQLGPPDGQFAYGFAAADFNEDGDIDLVFRAGRRIGDPGTPDDRFLFVPGKGDGSFASPITTRPGIGQISDLRPFDFDRDRHLDLLAVTGGGFWIFSGNGDGTFASPVSYDTTAGNAFEAEIADLDRDGFEDVVIASGFFGFSSPLSIFKGNGDGTFRRRVRFASGFDANMTIDIGNLDGDDRPDLVTQVSSGERNDNFAVLLNDTALPDLVAASITAPTELFSGDAVQLSYSVTNVSDHIAAASEWDDGIYLSTNATLDDTDVLLGAVHHGGGLGAHESYTETSIVVLPEDAVGAFFLIVAPDHDALLGELDERNNSRSIALTLAQPTFRTINHRGALANDETWERGVVHRVIGDTTVPNGRTLTIAAGAIVKFDQLQSLLVQPGGHLIAQGTVAEPIYFTSVRDDAIGGDTNRDRSSSQPSAGDWRKLLLDGGQTTLDHVHIRYGGGSIGGTGELTGSVHLIGNAQLTLSNSTVRDSRFEGVLTQVGNATIFNCVLTGNDRAVLSWLAGNNTVINTTLDDNRQALVAHGGALRVSNCIVTNSLEAGVQFDIGPQPEVRYSDVYSPPGSGSANYGNIADQTGVNGNVSVDPRYRNRAQGNYRIAFGSPCIDAADGTVAPANDLMGAPRYDDPRTPNSGVATSTGAFADMGAFEVVESAQSDVDLVVSAVSGPASATAGEQATIGWTITNLGAGTAVGPWHDTVNIVHDLGFDPTPIFAADVVVGAGAELGPGQSLTTSASVRVPGSVVGNHLWQVTTNSRQEVFEGENGANNATVSAAAFALDLPVLAVGGAARAGQLGAAGQQQWFKMTPTAGQDVSIALTLAAGNTAEVLIGRGFMPTRQRYDARSPSGASGNTAALVASAAAETYYILLHPASLAATTPFSLRATALAFSVASVAPSTIGNSAATTLRLQGGQLREDFTYELIAPSSQVIRATSVYAPTSAIAYATFDARGLTPGAYDLRVTPTSGAALVLNDAVSVQKGRSSLNASLSVPSTLRARRTVPITVSYGNSGNSDIKFPLLTVEVSDGELSAFPDSPGGRKITIVGRGMAPGLPVLSPGTQRSATLYFTAPQCGPDVEFKLRAGSLTDFADQDIDWNAISTELRPEGVADGIWNAYIDNERQRFGNTFGELCDYLSAQMREFAAADFDPQFVDGRWLFRFDEPADRTTFKANVTFDSSDIDALLEEARQLDPGPTALGSGGSSGGDGVQKVYVISVGDEDYSARNTATQPVNNLPGAKRDAEKIAALFNGTFNVQKDGAGQVASIIDTAARNDDSPSPQDIKDAIKETVDKADADDLVFVALSAHGCMVTEAGPDQGFTVQLNSGKLTAADLNQSFAGACGTVVFIADTCHAAGYTSQITNPHVVTAAAADFLQIAREDSSLTCALVDQMQRAPNGDVLQALDRAAKATADTHTKAFNAQQAVESLRGSNFRRTGSLRSWFEKLQNDLGAILFETALQEYARAQSPVIDPKGFPSITVRKDAKQPAVKQLQDKQSAAPPTFKSFSNVVCSVDPNDKVGPAGATQARFVAPDQTLVYRINFENDPRRASAAAQEVIVTDQLDTDLDWSTFRLVEMGFGAHRVSVPPGLSQYRTSVGLVPDGVDLDVQIDAGIDTRTGVARWSFVSADPETGRLTEDPILGFLPVNDESHAGEGFVTFSVQPRPGLATATTIQNAAAIVFDVNAPLATNTETNTIDADPPVSQVAPLPGASGAEVMVSWSGSDAGSGIASYDIYVSIDGGPFVLWLEATELQSAVFHGGVNRTYEFYSVARDRVGQIEAAPATADATTRTTGSCVGDCDDSGDVTIDELIIAVNIALGLRQVTDCPPFDIGGSSTVTIDQIIQAVNSALGSCGP